MKFSSELASWLCLSQTGASLHAQFPAACRDRCCRLCGHPLASVNEALPCLHWLTGPYCKPGRIEAVFAAYAVAEVVRYVLLWTLSESRRCPSRHLRCARQCDATEIHIGFRNRSWNFLLQGEHQAFFEYSSHRTGFGFRLPLTLQHGDAAALRQLAHLV